jgi:D-ribose pyranose/furanose isomerase RbsD
MRPIPAFFLGAFLAPLFGSVLRPLLREVVKEGVLLAHEVHKVAQEVREEVEDAKAEAISQTAPISQKKK